MILCKPCQEEGREQVHHHFKEMEEGRPPVPVCRWHFKGLAHPASRQRNAGSQQLPAKETMGRKKSKIDETRLRELHGQGLRDVAIGKALGCSPPTVCVYRKKLGLAAHPKASKARLFAPPATPPPGFVAQPLKQQATRPISAPRGKDGSGILVPVRLELLDAIWAELEPEEKGRLLNHLIETREDA